MADQEFLASFGVEIDEAGVARLQSAMEENKALAEELASAFDAASASVRTFAEELGFLPDFSGNGVTAEGLSGFGGLSLGLDLEQAGKDLDAFITLAKKPIPLSADASGVTAAARTAWSSVRSIFSGPLTLRAKVETEGEGDETPVRMSSGGRFSRPTEVQVAEEGGAEYIIPVTKENRAVPLLRQLLNELSPAARESLAGGAGTLSFSGGLSAGTAPAGNITQDNRTVSAPVNIQVHSSGADAEQIGQSLYDVTERYLLRTLQSAFV